MTFSSPRPGRSSPPPDTPPAVSPPTRGTAAADGGEQALLAGLRNGDPAAFELLVRQETGPCLAAARRLLRNEEDARDAVQEAFLSAFKAIGTFQGSSRLGTWLHRIVINTALMRLRSRRCRPERSIEDLLPQFNEDGHHLVPPAPVADDAAERLLLAERRHLVHDAIDLLPDNYREVVLLRDFEGLCTEECATLLGTTPNAVKIRLHRARQALRTLLERHFGKTDP